MKLNILKKSQLKRIEENNSLRIREIIIDSYENRKNWEKMKEITKKQ